MITINENYLKLKASYLFADIAKRVSHYQETHPGQSVIKLGIGDVTRSLPPACISAMHHAVDEMSQESTFKGYGPEQGYAFLREKIAQEDFGADDVDIAPDEIFISDGAKCDTGNIQEIFSSNIRVAVPDPVYPVYVDTNVMAGRSGEFREGKYENLQYLACTRENAFIPELPKGSADLIYLCFPNNPTGATIGKDALRQWVEYAHAHKALILYDAAYEAFIRDDRIPHSIYEVEGAREVAIEFRSFSKTAGFTGIRCAFAVVPKTCRAFDSQGNLHHLHGLWNRRHSTKFNGVSYPVQRAAEAVYSPEGKEQVKERIDGYLQNAALIRKEMQGLGYETVGGENSPYIWVYTRMNSWDFFDLLLKKAGVVCTPGAGFGRCGGEYIRISAFNNFENVQEAMQRIGHVLST
jgi:LL-diaminopimelate aminotransferase